MSKPVRLGPEGGVVDTPANTPLGYAVTLKNCYYRNGSWLWRPGVTKLHANEYVDTLAGAHAFRTTGPGSPTWTLLTATRGTAALKAHFARLVGAAFVAIPYNGTPGPDFDADDAWRAWRFARVSDVKAYACRRTYKGGALYNVQADSVTLAGIPAPPAPAVVDSAGAGVLTAGAYVCAYRFRTSDGMLSPWSPSFTATIAALKKRAWTIATSTHPRVTSRELGVSYPDQTDVFVAYTVTDNTATTVEEDVLPAAYSSRLADFNLGLPPDNPEDAIVWGGLLWLVSNDPAPALWRCAVDTSAVWELFDPTKVLIPGSGASQRVVALRAFDDDNLALLMDASVYRVESFRTESGAGQYAIRQIEGSSGCVSASACAGGAGAVAWFDGRNFMASRGGAAAEIVSRGRVDVALSNVPASHAARAIMHYDPDDSGCFLLSVPQSAGEPALVVAWRPTDANAFLARYLGGDYAPTFMERIPAPDAGWYTVGGFPPARAQRVVRLDAPVRRDESYNIAVEIEPAAIPLPDEAGTVSVRAVHVGVRRRPDTGLPDPGVPISCDVALRLNDGALGTPVTAVVPTGGEYLHARVTCEPRANVQVNLKFDHPDLLEVFDVSADVVYYRRHEVRT